MVKIKLTGHDYRYETFHILSLFYDKSEMDFDSQEGPWNIESVLDFEKSTASCIIYPEGGEPIKKELPFRQDDTKDAKNIMRATLLESLKSHTGKDIPWGILVGIRPTKIVHDLLARGLKNDEVIEKLVSYYRLSRDKAELTLEVALREIPSLLRNKRDVSLYIGIPFCPTRCVYCSFTSNPIGKNGQLVEDYLDALIREVKETLNAIAQSGLNVDTLYIGGGTPTSLSASQMKRLFNALGEALDLKGIREFTVEAGRPDSIDKEKLLAIKDAGCKRISINPQTMNDETLKRIGRNHTTDDIIETYKLAREIGFDVINMDIIIGLPGEGIDEIKTTIEGIRKLSPENVTIHTMSIKRASILNEREYSDKSLLAAEMYDIAVEGIRDMGLEPYYMYRQKNMVTPLENIGFCSEGTECVYNVQMIAENISIISMGADAVTKLVFDKENRIERVANLKDVREYINRIDEIIDNKLRAVEMIGEYYK
jgi:coproporphyrinogen dehydrogenase HemZ